MNQSCIVMANTSCVVCAGLCVARGNGGIRKLSVLWWEEGHACTSTHTRAHTHTHTHTHTLALHSLFNDRTYWKPFAAWSLKLSFFTICQLNEVSDINPEYFLLSRFELFDFHKRNTHTHWWDDEMRDIMTLALLQLLLVLKHVWIILQHECQPSRHIKCWLYNSANHW